MTSQPNTPDLAETLAATETDDGFMIKCLRHRDEIIAALRAQPAPTISDATQRMARRLGAEFVPYEPAPTEAGADVERVARALCAHFDEDWTITGNDWLDAARAALASTVEAASSVERVWSKPEYAAADAAYAQALQDDPNDRMSALASAVDAALSASSLPDDRGAIVAWLREKEGAWRWWSRELQDVGAAHMPRLLADAIERGDHLKEPDHG